MNDISSLEVTGCAYALCMNVLNPNDFHYTSILPGSVNYDITQIFLNRIANGTPTPGVSDFMNFHFPELEVNPLPVEVFWASLGIEFNKSCWKIYSPPTKNPNDISILFPKAAKVNEIFKNILEGNLKKLHSLSKNLNKFAYGSLTFKSTPLEQKELMLFPQKQSLKEFYYENIISNPDGLIEQLFIEVEQLFLESENIDKLPLFLKEWKSMNPREKIKAGMHDPFVMQFEEIFKKIRRLYISRGG